MPDIEHCKRVAQGAVTGLTTIEHFDTYAYLKQELAEVPVEERGTFLANLFVAATYLHGGTLGAANLIAEIMNDPSKKPSKGKRNEN